MNAAWRYLKERLQSLTHQSSTLVLVSLAHGINHAQSALKPLIYPIVLREFNVGYGELGVMLGIASALGGLLQLAAGALGTVVRRNLLLGWGNVAVGISVMIIALAQNFAQFFLWNVAARVGGAAQHPVGSSLIAHHFHRERLGLALATHFSAGNVGTALIPLVAAVLISLWGWRITTALFAIPAILVGLAICAWLNDPRLSHEHAPETHNHSFWRHGWEATANPRLRWILVASIAAAGGSGHGTISVYIPLYLTDALGMESSAVGFVFSLLMVGGIAGPLLGGRLVDRFNRQWVVLSAYAIAAVVTVGFPWAAGQTLLLPIAAFLLGTTSFAVTPILQTVIAQVTEDRTRDFAFALFYTAAFMAGGIWSPAIGYIAEGVGLGVAFAVMASSFILAGLCLLAARLDEVPSGVAPPVHTHGHV